ncbi:MAG: T9SS type A sorting domain-containing protein [Bacteroidota bacterium]
MQLYPNPAIDRVYIDYTETKKVTMQVYNIIGECVLQSELMGGRNEIDAGKLSKGVYVIQIIGKNWKAQRKLTKE